VQDSECLAEVFADKKLHKLFRRCTWRASVWVYVDFHVFK